MTLGYLLLWPGMDATAFLDGRSHPAKPGIGEWALALFNLAAGLVLLFVVTPRITGEHAIVAGWIGMIGLVLVLHFGLFHVMSLCWRFNRRRRSAAHELSDLVVLAQRFLGKTVELWRFDIWPSPKSSARWSAEWALPGPRWWCSSSRV